MILMTFPHLNQMCNHALATYPEECCGLLLGTINNTEKLIVEVRATPNSWSLENEESFPTISPSIPKVLSKQTRFAIAPQIILQVQKEARDRALQIIGVYHSHPDYLAIPSEFDRAIAWSDYSYIIISVQSDQTTDLKSWQLDDNRQFQAENIQIL
ncbi:Mov34/MPN/PAD-1 family protein [Rippkaea orientalis PCC 8801]|uniref:Mov34/MPN/PAD-1 family protein n=1 Tax=Rippkaea orientalis (strain PCC 8801 / RF-1) TaxID=41431 RepID=B7JV53_RIPO1|nr:M67 family metallopeptidase [Rippkaea orientalis]ACK66905.1 Mov34/MPN/PAD-1 family protein [Rippkaea orientalis PCC 8801]